MFTGIVDHCGKITAVTHLKNAIRLSLSTTFSDLTLGESICADGVCLTVINVEKNIFECDLSPETLKLTISKKYFVGDVVNLERAMKLSDRLSGHFVTGHVDGILKIKKIEKQEEFFLMEFFDIQKQDELLLTKKGSVCINGVSLTINQLNQHYFSVMLIPHTMQRTNLSRLKENDFVNVEYDYLAKIIQKRSLLECL